MRSLFVIVLILVGGCYALKGPFFGLLFYIGNAYFRPEDWVWTDFIRNLNLSLISGIYVILASLLSGQRFAWGGRIALLFLFLFHTFISTLLSEHFVSSWGYWIEFLKTIVVTYFIVVLVTDLQRLRLVFLVMILALGADQAKQGWLYFFASHSWRNENSIPFLGDNNCVAIGLLMLVPLIGVLLQTTLYRWAVPLYWFVIVGVLSRVFSTQSRGGFLAFLCMGMMYILRSPQKWRVLLAAFVVIVILLPTLPDTFWGRVKTMQTYEDSQDESIQGRFHFWAVAIEMGNAKPLWGVGYNGYNLSYDDYDFSGGRYGRQRAVHSSSLGVLAELGYVGFSLYMLILAGALRASFRLRKLGIRNAAFSQLGMSASALEISLVVFLIGGSFIPFQYNEMVWHFIGLTIAIERLALREHVLQTVGIEKWTSLGETPVAYRKRSLQDAQDTG